LLLDRFSADRSVLHPLDEHQGDARVVVAVVVVVVWWWWWWCGRLDGSMSVVAFKSCARPVVRRQDWRSSTGCVQSKLA
jgi:hypothetical protein